MIGGIAIGGGFIMINKLFPRLTTCVAVAFVCSTLLSLQAPWGTRMLRAQEENSDTVIEVLSNTEEENSKTPEATPTAVPENDLEEVPEDTPTPTPTPEEIPEDTPTPTPTPEEVPEDTPTPTPTPTPTGKPATPVPTEPLHTPTPTGPAGVTPTNAPATPTQIPVTPTEIPVTPVPTAVISMTPAATPTVAPTMTAAATPTAAPSISPIETPSPAPSETPVPTVTAAPTATPAATATPAPTAPPLDERGIIGFVTRLYRLVLNRNPEQDGLEFWTGNLRSGNMTAAEVSHGFVTGEEFRNRELSNRERLDIMYRTFMDREGEADGVAFWMGKLEDGISLEELYSGFVNAEEFHNVCSSYGVEAGMYMQGFELKPVNRTYSFVNRLYKKCLDRNGDFSGLHYWVKKIMNQQLSIGEVAAEFIFSKEYKNKDVDLEAYMTTLYRVFMNRKPDDEGMDSWMRCGRPREYIFNAFVASEEFSNICNSYGLKKYNLPFSKPVPKTRKDLPLKGKVVFIDPGHGQTDPGAVVYGVKEAPINLSIGLKTKEALEELGATVIITRTSDKWVSLYSRNAMVHRYCLQYLEDNNLPSVPYYIRQYIETSLTNVLKANSNEADGMGIMGGTGMCDEMKQLFFVEQSMDNFVFISIHCNAASSKSAHGTSIYYVTDSSMKESEARMVKNDPALYRDPRCPIRGAFTGRDGETNAYFSSCLYRGVVGQVPQFASYRHIIEDNFCVLREHGLTSAMVEVAYMTNNADLNNLLKSSVQQNVAQGIADGVVMYFEGQ